MVGGAVATIGLTSFSAMGLASAQSTTNGTDTGMSGLVDKLATKFGLNKADVQAVFDEERAARETEIQAKLESELTQAVTDGKLTEAQKSAILAKRTELQTAREAKRTEDQTTKTDEERKVEMDTNKTALDKWATDNNIPTEYLRYVFGGGHGGGPGGRGGFGKHGTPPSTVAPANSTTTN